MKLRTKLFTLAAAFTLIAMLIGCSSTATSTASATAKSGILTLSVNPRIRIEYNQDGNVTGISGANSDGENIVSSYPDYVGKDCITVLKELITEINNAGYFVEDIDGNQKNIVLQLEPGSVLPQDDFLEVVTRSTEEAVIGLNLTSGIVTIEDDDYDPAYSKNGVPSPYITLEKAQEIALTQANVKLSDALLDDKDFDFEKGTPVFELEFIANGQEYDYHVDAITGKVVKAEHKPVRTTNYRDTDYGPNNDGITDYRDTDYGPSNDGVTDYNDTDYGPNNDGITDYLDTDYGPNNDGITDYLDTDYGPNNDGVTDYNDTDYGPNNDGVTDYNDTDYGPNNDGVTDYNDTDYGPNNDGVTDYNDTDYGPNNDGVTDYNDTDYGPNNDGVTDYHDSNYHSNNNSDYQNSDYGKQNGSYGNSDYDD